MHSLLNITHITYCKDKDTKRHTYFTLQFRVVLDDTSDQTGYQCLCIGKKERKEQW